MNKQAFIPALRAFLTGCLLAFLPLLLVAQPVAISGRITDAATGDVLTGVTLQVAGTTVGTYSDKDGAYTLSFDPGTQATFQVRITYAGYAEQTLPVSRADGSSQRKDIALQPAQEYKTGDVVISATKGFEQAQADVPVSISVMKQDAIDLQAVPAVDKVISQIPGVDNQGGQINIRGSSGYAYGVGSRVMVTLDGLPLLTGDAGTANLDLIPVDNISQIEVMKGAASVLYGSAALGGVISIITADPGDKPRTSLRLRGGFFGQPANAALDWDGAKSPWYSSAHLFHARKIGDLSLTLQTNFIKSTGYRQGTDTETSRSMLMLKYQPKAIKGLTLGLNASLNIDSTGSILYWHSYTPGMVVGLSGDTTISRGALTPTPDAGGYRLQLTRDLALDPTIRYLTPGGGLIWYRGRYMRGVSQNNTNQSSTNSIFYNDLLYQRTFNKQISWVAGVTYTRSDIQGDSLYGGTYVYEGDTIQSGGGHYGNSLGVYTQFDAKLGTRLNVSLGFRYEAVQIDTVISEAQPILRVGINYKLAEGTNIRASFGQAFRVPSVAERFANTAGGGIVVEPNPAIGSERGYSAEIGLRQGFLLEKNRLKLMGYLDLAGFVMDYNDMVEFGIRTAQLLFIPGQGLVTDVRFTSVNVARARIPGVELTGGMQLHRGERAFVNISGGITYIEPRDLNAVPDSLQLDLVTLPLDFLNPQKSDQPPFLKYRSRWTVRTSLSMGIEPVSLTLNYRYKSFVQNVDQYLFLVVKGLDEFRQKYPGGDHVLDAILSVNLFKNNQVSLVVDNVFNREYLVIPGYLAPQRSYTLQYLIRF
ncbi:MAG: hypothetical protein OHK0039_03100 [Bacteroidia bacterium]